ncbi:MAG: DUF1731 domain-containing protein [Phycisphaerales bacterium]
MSSCGETRARRVVIAGGSGFLGTSLAAFLAGRGAGVTVLSRGRGTAGGAWKRVVWDGRSLGGWVDELDGACALVNLAGRSVNCVKTPDHCDEILRSRVESTRVLGQACAAVRTPPPVWVQMSTAHIYGDPPREVCDEGSALGVGLAPTVGRAWEAAFDGARLAGQRGVVLRTSFVIGRRNAGGAGALGTLAVLGKLGLGGAVGAGTQGFSWLHEVDFHRIVEAAVTEGWMEGVYVASAPSPVTQREFIREVRRRAGGLGGVGVGLPAPEWMVRVGARVALRTDPELALYGRFVVPARLRAQGFAFRFGELGAALDDLFPRRGRREPARGAGSPGR